MTTWLPTWLRNEINGLRHTAGWAFIFACAAADEARLRARRGR